MNRGTRTGAALAFAGVLAASAFVAGCKDCSGGGSPSSSSGATTEPAKDAAPSDGAVVNATVLPTASVAAMVNPDKLPPYDGPSGSIEGTITVTGDPPVPTPSDFSVCAGAAATWDKSFREGPGRTLADALVVVTGYKGYVPAKDEAKQIDIEGCAYTTRTIALTLGQRLEVKNRTKDFWTPVLQPGSTSVMMMAAPNGDPVRLYPKKPGRFLVVDRDRKYVDVDVFVLLQPLAGVTDKSGHYRIDGIPVGKVKVGAMHPRFNGDAEREIEIKSGVIEKVDITLRHARPDAGPPAEDAGWHPTLH